MATLDKLPNELLLLLASFSKLTSSNLRGIQRDLARLALVNRRFRDVFDPILWRFNNEQSQKNKYAIKSAVSWAISRNRIDILEKAHRYQLLLDSNNDCTLWAVDCGHSTVLSWLLDHGVPTECTPREIFWTYSRHPTPEDHVFDTESPLHRALEARRESAAILLLSRGAKFHFISGNLPDSSAIHLAAYHGLHTVIMYLVKTMGIDVDYPNGANRTPLHLAVRRPNNREMILTLLDLGANVNAGQSYVAPLTEAISHGQFDNAMLLLDAGANVNTPTAYASTPLIRCISSPVSPYKDKLALQGQVLRRLIDMGADLEDTENLETGGTALNYALSHGTTSTVFELLNAGADVQKPAGPDLKTPFEFLWTINNISPQELTSKASLLVAAGARLDTPDLQSGKTQLQNAIDYCHNTEWYATLNGLLLFTTCSNIRAEHLDELFEDCLLKQSLEPAKILLLHGANSKAARQATFAWALDIIEKDQFDENNEAFNFCLDFGLSNEALESLLLAAMTHISLNYINEDRAHILIGRGAIPAAEEPGPWLHHAARNGSTTLVRRLCRAGMDVNALSTDFKTPMMAALENRQRVTADLLFNLGADPFLPRPDSECRQMPNMSTEIISPFEFAIRKNLRLDMEKWWLKSPSAFRPKEELYIPRVLLEGDSLYEAMKRLRGQTGDDPSEIMSDEDLEWFAEFDEVSESMASLALMMARIRGTFGDVFDDEELDNVEEE
ncbi:ankyrin [Hypoxylon fuscum]|nr:ankyrin [Hypoxylon fuscum]